MFEQYVAAAKKLRKHSNEEELETSHIFEYVLNGMGVELLLAPCYEWPDIALSLSDKYDSVRVYYFNSDLEEWKFLDELRNGHCVRS